MNDKKQEAKERKQGPDETGIYWKVQELQGKINKLEEKIKHLDDSIEKSETGDTSNAAVGGTDSISAADQIAILRKQIALYKEESALYKEKSALMDKKSALMDKKSALKETFFAGYYYAAASEYWEVSTCGKNYHSPWLAHTRTSLNFQCRNATNGNLVTRDEYNLTKAGAEQEDAAKANSDGTHASSQSNESLQYKIWPADIFGNVLEEGLQGEIAHIVPGGKWHSKHWFNIAAAAVGLPCNAGLEKKLKALHGIQEKSKTKQTNKDSGPETEASGNIDAGSGESSVCLNQEPAIKKAKKGTHGNRREQFTGVVHFVSNKMRLSAQEIFLDGRSLLLVPVMTMEDAVNWQGEGYSAIVLVGSPRKQKIGENEMSNKGLSSVYNAIRVNTKQLIGKNNPRDATEDELETARLLLCESIIAMNAMIANLTDEEIEAVDKKDLKSNSFPLMDARLKAQSDDDILVPVSIPQSVKQRRPICLIKFCKHSGSKEETLHPAPDPFLMAMRAANTWGRLTDGAMLAAGSVADDESISDGDMIAEQAYYDEHFGRPLRPTSWQDLAIGLGQPNGYVPDTN